VDCYFSKEADSELLSLYFVCHGYTMILGLIPIVYVKYCDIMNKNRATEIMTNTHQTKKQSLNFDVNFNFITLNTNLVAQNVKGAYYVYTKY